MLTIPKPGRYLARFRNVRGHDQGLLRCYLHQGLPSEADGIYLRDARSHEIAYDHSPRGKARRSPQKINKTSNDIVDLICAVRRQLDNNICGPETSALSADAPEAEENRLLQVVAGGIAHHFNNLFMGIQSNVSLLLQKNDICLSNYEGLKRIEKLVQTESMLTNDLLTHLVKNRSGLSATFRKKMTAEIVRLSRKIKAAHDVPGCNHTFDPPARLNPDRPAILNDCITYIIGRLLLEIQTITAAMLNKSHPGRSEYKRLNRINAYILSGFEMVEDLLCMADQGYREHHVMSWHQLVETALDTYFSIQMPMRIHLSVADNLPAIKAPPRLIEKIFLNLFVNAAEAMPGGGDLYFDLKRVTWGEEPERSEGLQPGAYMLLRIRDNGHGMAAGTLARAFEPFYTSKGPKLGRGLGLPCTLGIVKMAGGAMTMDSHPGRGTTINVYLPTDDSEKSVMSKNRFKPDHFEHEPAADSDLHEQRFACFL